MANQQFFYLRSFNKDIIANVPVGKNQKGKNIMAEAVNGVPPFTTLKYVTKDGEHCTATKQNGIVRVQSDKNGVKYQPYDEFMKDFLNNLPQINLERKPNADTVSFSGGSEAKASKSGKGWLLAAGIFATGLAAYIFTKGKTKNIVKNTAKIQKHIVGPEASHISASEIVEEANKMVKNDITKIKSEVVQITQPETKVPVAKTENITPKNKETKIPAANTQNTPEKHKPVKNQTEIQKKKPLSNSVNPQQTDKTLEQIENDNLAIIAAGLADDSAKGAKKAADKVADTIDDAADDFFDSFRHSKDPLQPSKDPLHTSDDFSSLNKLDDAADDFLNPLNTSDEFSSLTRLDDAADDFLNPFNNTDDFMNNSFDDFDDFMDGGLF